HDSLYYPTGEARRAALCSCAKAHKQLIRLSEFPSALYITAESAHWTELIQTFLLCRRKRRRRENCYFNHLIAEWGYHHFRCVSSIRSHNHSVTSDRELKARWTD